MMDDDNECHSTISTISTSSMMHNEERQKQDDNDGLRFVFGGMPFHCVHIDPSSTRSLNHRHSLSVPPPPMPPADYYHDIASGMSDTCNCNIDPIPSLSSSTGDNDHDDNEKRIYDPDMMMFVPDLISSKMRDQPPLQYCSTYCML